MAHGNPSFAQVGLKNSTVKRGNFDWRGNFDRSGSFVKVAMVPIQECLFVASAFMEINV